MANNDKRVAATIRLLKSNTNLTIPKAMRAAQFTLEESRDVVLQLQVRRRMSTSVVASRKNIISAACLLCGAVLFAVIISANRTTPSKATKDKPAVINKAAICAIQKGGLKYIDEWVDFHLGIGFGTIYLYDNSDNFELQGWYSERLFQHNEKGTERVQIIHWPGVGKNGQQLPAYAHCTKEIRKHKRHSWIAFIDIDEFFVIKDTDKHPFIMNVLDSIPSKAGGLAVNWRFFEWNNQTRYEAKPLTMRFTRRKKLDPINVHVKIIARTDALKDIWPTPHEARYKNFFRGKKYETVDTSGMTVKGPFNHRVPTDVLVIHHYGDKSRSSDQGVLVGDLQRLMGNNKTTYLACKSEEEVLAEWRRTTDGKDGYLADDSAWTLLKERIPEYASFETRD
ncbi:LOW QUALITY PROTEIN: hypothetical protein ACHAXM_000455 [Skeletonema potamos]